MLFQINGDRSGRLKKKVVPEERVRSRCAIRNPQSGKRQWGNASIAHNKNIMYILGDVTEEDRSCAFEGNLQLGLISFFL